MAEAAETRGEPAIKVIMAGLSDYTGLAMP
jgi:hypothetical protein